MKVRQAGDSAVDVGVLNAVALRNTNREPAHIGALGRAHQGPAKEAISQEEQLKEQEKGIA
ncbi:MAG: hypothetical protein QXY52_03500 [Conexivisphaerales archaeon]